jgi:LysM repeat protein
MSDINVAMVQARRLELHDHPAPPAGAEVHANGLFHEVQKGDSATAIAREYSQAYHMDISASQLRAANPAVFQAGLAPGQLLRVPGVQQRFDTMFLAANPRLSRVGDHLVHTVRSGDTLSNIARRYNEADGLRLTADQLYAANKSTIGSNPGAIRPGQQLVVPGITTASPKATLQSAKELAGDTLLTRTSRVRHADGTVESIDVMRYTGDMAHAERFATIDAAQRMLHADIQDGVMRGPVAIVQARDGAFLNIPLIGHEVSANLDDSDRPLSLAMRADQRGVVGSAELDRRVDDAVIRRFDR